MITHAYLYTCYVCIVHQKNNKNNFGLELLRRLALNQGYNFSMFRPKLSEEVQTDTGFGRKGTNRFSIIITNMSHY